jgi:hypothetical protein
MIMELWEQIIQAFPELNPTDNFEKLGIFLKDDSDGTGVYISKWEYSKPLTKELKTYLR